LAAKCTELQRKLEAAVAERAQAKTATEQLTRELERANQKMAYAQQPYNYLVEVLQNAESKLEESRTHASTLQMEVEAARAAKRQLRDVTMDREALRDDMRTLLEERTMLQDMRKTLSSALARPINTPAGTERNFGGQTVLVTGGGTCR